MWTNTLGGRRDESERGGEGEKETRREWTVYFAPYGYVWCTPRPKQGSLRAEHVSKVWVSAAAKIAHVQEAQARLVTSSLPPPGARYERVQTAARGLGRGRWKDRFHTADLSNSPDLSSARPFSFFCLGFLLINIFFSIFSEPCYICCCSRQYIRST